SSVVYYSVAYYFARDDVTLHGFSHFFKENSKEEREHAEKLLSFQNKRGGQVVLHAIKKPERDELASEKTDPHMCDFLETHYLNEQVEAIKKLGDHMTNLSRMGAPSNGLAEYLFDKDTLGGSS
ncbi:ferritin, middle subunit, partial [Amia ocellicauda]|uniref:ferritin, middle subunit n=1 Tax=Amia ocellicauda TaxID=2972642 RepID=UPI0034642403